MTNLRAKLLSYQELTRQDREDIVAEIDRLRGALEYIWKWDRIVAAAAPSVMPDQAEIARRCLAGEDAEL